MELRINRVQINRSRPVLVFTGKIYNTYTSLFLIPTIVCLQCSYLRPANEVLGKVMFLHLCVILFTGVSASGGLHAGVCIRGVCIQGDLHPGGSASRRGSASRGWADPSPQALQDTVNKRAVHIILECILAISMSTIPTGVYVVYLQ